MFRSWFWRSRSSWARALRFMTLVLGATVIYTATKPSQHPRRVLPKDDRIPEGEIVWDAVRTRRHALTRPAPAGTHRPDRKDRCVPVGALGETGRRGDGETAAVHPEPATEERSNRPAHSLPGSLTSWRSLSQDDPADPADPLDEEAPHRPRQDGDGGEKEAQLPKDDGRRYRHPRPPNAARPPRPSAPVRPPPAPARATKHTHAQACTVMTGTCAH